MPDITEEWQAVYSHAGRSAHLVRAHLPAAEQAAACGTESVAWLGTGSFAETQTAERLPLCSHCYATIVTGTQHRNPFLGKPL